MTKISNQYSLTNILTADLANSRLGINNVNPTVALDVTGAGKFSSSLSATSYNATTQNIFSVDGSEKMRITSTGNVGIGTTTVSSLLTLSQSAFNKTTLGDARVIRLENSDPTVQLNSRQEIGFGYSTAYQPVVIGHQITNNTDFTNGSFYIAVRSGVGNTAPVQALTVVAGGNVGIGTTSPSAKLEVIGYGTANSIMTYVCAKFYGAGTGGINIGTDGTNPQIATDSSGVDLTFLTRVAGTFSERMRITSGGTVGIGVVPSNEDPILIVKGRNNTSSGYALILQSSTSNLMLMRNDGYAYIAASAWAYGSDIRMKENISDVANGLDLVSKLKPKHFDYINGAKNNLGFIAQEVQELIPQAVSISDEKTGMLALKTDFIIPYLVKAIQELSAKVSLLENK